MSEKDLSIEDIVDEELSDLAELMERRTWDEEPDLEVGIDDEEEDED